MRLGHQSDDGGGETGWCIDPGPNGGSAQRQFLQLWQHVFQTLDRLSDLGRPSAELLAQSDRRGVHEVGPPGFHDVFELGGLGLQRAGEPGEGRHQILSDGRNGCDMDCGGNDVVG